MTHRPCVLNLRAQMLEKKRLKLQPKRGFNRKRPEKLRPRRLRDIAQDLTTAAEAEAERSSIIARDIAIAADAAVVGKQGADAMCSGSANSKLHKLQKLYRVYT